MSTEQLAPLARLTRSREQLRQSMNPARRPPGDGDGRRHDAASQTWLDAFLPGAAVLTGLVRQAWSRHPLHAVAGVAAGAATLALKPLAARHPWGLVAGGVALGGALAWSRPWRWTLKPALLAGVLPQLLVALLKAPPNRPPPPPAP